MLRSQIQLHKKRAIDHMKHCHKKHAFTLIELAIVILIIGIVIAGVLAANQLISKARISAAQNLTKSAPIAATSDTIFWLESSLPTSFQSSEADDGKSLSIWNNNADSDTVNDAIAGSSAPTYANTINRIHAAKFSDGQHFVINGASLNYSYYTIVVVEKRLSNSSDNYFIGDPTVTTDNQSLLLGYSANNKIIHSQGATNSYTANVDTYEDSSGSPRIIVFVSSPTGKKTYINGVLAASSSNTSRLSNISSLVIGKAYNGEIGEIAAFARALTDAERGEIETYLSKKYEIKKYSGSCVGGTMKISGCNAATCSLSASGISATVNAGSDSIACNQPGYSGTVSYDCTGGVGSISGSCSAITCTIAAANGFAAKSGLIYAASATAISSPCQSGYTASTPAPTYTCATSGAASVSGSCVQNTCSVSVTGSATTSITQGGGNITCDQTGYTGTFTNNCSTNGGTVSGVCGCNTGGGYVLNAGGTACVATSSITCSITATSSLVAKTNLPYAATARSIPSPCQTGSGYTGSATYTCTASGLATVVSNLCFSGCGMISNGAGGTFNSSGVSSNAQYALKACESVYGVGQCSDGRCGSFYYYYQKGSTNCGCAKPTGSYEFIYNNTGYTKVGEDYNPLSANIGSDKLFVRIKQTNDCSANSWGIAKIDFASSCPGATD